MEHLQSPGLIVLRLNQCTVRDGHVLLRNGHDYLASSPVVGIVVARKPVSIVFVLSLCPNLVGLLREGLVGSDKVQSSPRLTRVPNTDSYIVSGLQRLVQVDYDLPTSILIVRLATARAILVVGEFYLLDFELDSVKLQASDVFRYRLQSKVSGSIQPLLLGVNYQIQADVLDVVVPVSRIMGCRSGKYERVMLRTKAVRAAIILQNGAISSKC